MKTLFRFLTLTVAVAFLCIGCGSKFTWENYARVEIGMTKDQVSEILGNTKDKREMDAPGLGKQETWTYGSMPGMISGEDEYMFVITFLNGKVSNKMSR